MNLNKITFCNNCNCMSHNLVNDVCGKCKENKTPTLSKEAEKLFDDTFHIDRVGWRGRGNDCHVAEIFPYDDEGRQVVPDVADLKQVISQIEQSAILAERKAIYKMVMENGSANRASILHKLARIIQGEEKL